MEKFSVNDWLTIQTRKDLSLLRRSLKHDSIQYGIIIELLLVVLSACLDNVFTGENRVPSWLWIIISGAAGAVSVVSIWYCVHRAKKQRKERLLSPSVSELVDLFDNEICYNIMTADSMDDHLVLENGVIKDIDATQNAVQKFYFIEACYYLDKVIKQLFKFEKAASQAICREENEMGVSLDRFLNVCILVYNNYSHLIQIAGDKEEYLSLLRKCKIDKFNATIKQLGKNDGYIELENCLINTDGLYK